MNDTAVVGVSEGPVPRPEMDPVGGDEVEVAVVVEITDGQRGGVSRGHGEERALAFVQQDRDVARVGVGEGQVGAAVAGEVARRDRDGLRPDRDRARGVEMALPVPPQDPDVAGARGGAVFGDRQVEVAVAREVAHRDGQGDLLKGDRCLGGEVAARRRPSGS